MTDSEKERSIKAALEDFAQGKPVKMVSLGKKGIYFDGQVVRDCTCILEGADPHSIRELQSGLVHADKNYVWESGGHIVPLADGPTFKTFGGIDGIYAKDKFHVYCKGDYGRYISIEGADPKTFKALDFAYAKDSKRIYSSGKVLEDVGSQYTIDQCGFLKGEKAVYHYTFRLPVDASSFKVMNLDEKLKDTNPFLGKFQISDLNGTYLYIAEGGSSGRRFISPM